MSRRLARVQISSLLILAVVVDIRIRKLQWRRRRHTACSLLSFEAGFLHKAFYLFLVDRGHGIMNGWRGLTSHVVVAIAISVTIAIAISIASRLASANRDPGLHASLPHQGVRILQ